MTSAQIRDLCNEAAQGIQSLQVHALMEIAYQLAVLNEREERREVGPLLHPALARDQHNHISGMLEDHISGMLRHGTANAEQTAEPNPPEATK